MLLWWHGCIKYWKWKLTLYVHMIGNIFINWMKSITIQMDRIPSKTKSMIWLKCKSLSVTLRNFIGKTLGNVQWIAEKKFHVTKTFSSDWVIQFLAGSNFPNFPKSANWIIKSCGYPNITFHVERLCKSQRLATLHPFPSSGPGARFPELFIATLAVTLRFLRENAVPTFGR